MYWDEKVDILWGKHSLSAAEHHLPMPASNSRLEARSRRERSPQAQGACVPLIKTAEAILGTTLNCSFVCVSLLYSCKLPETWPALHVLPCTFSNLSCCKTCLGRL